jgi:hypothetical protein
MPAQQNELIDFQKRVLKTRMHENI